MIFKKLGLEHFGNMLLRPSILNLFWEFPTFNGDMHLLLSNSNKNVLTSNIAILSPLLEVFIANCKGSSQGPHTPSLREGTSYQSEIEKTFDRG